MNESVIIRSDDTGNAVVVYLPHTLVGKPRVTKREILEEAARVIRQEAMRS